MMKYLYFFLLIMICQTALFAEDIKYNDSWGKTGFSLKDQTAEKVLLNFSVNEFSILNTTINGKGMQELSFADVILPNEEGAPNLPGTGRYIAIPNGASVELELVNFRVETIQGVDIAPAPRIPWDTETGPLEYTPDNDIYSANKFYPEHPVMLSEKTEIRGIEAAMLGITPFQYNPVTKELKVYRDIEIELTFTSGDGSFGNERLRSRWWDPILQDVFLNQESIPDMDYNKSYQGTKDVGCEYLIITPNNQVFQSWADSIKQFRTSQGIMTDVITLDEVGGNTINAIQNFVNDAYYNWDIVPAAVLLLGDYGTNADNRIISPIWDSYCVSDNIYADVTNNDMPDIVFARMTAQDEDQLEVMITKFLNYETNPPTNPDFYNHPITALGWQTERWFQICSEAVGGFWKNELGKSPVRINEVYGGDPTNDPWSTATNTYTVLNVFGPNGLGYLPASPNDLGNWSGGDPEMINNAINSGAFVLQHRDHGYEQGWGEPAYSSGNINSLTNTDLTFIFSVNCLTGKYNLSGSCFTETFHRYTNNGQNSGALGLIAASEVSYSFVNDAYVWGMYDNLWPEFMPDYGTTPEHRGVMPAFGNAAGKYFLQQSNWPYNTGNKEVTYNLFHHHGDAFLNLYTEVPQNLTVIHDNVLLDGMNTFSILANEGSLIGLTVDGEIIATELGTGESMQISIPAQSEGAVVKVTVTMQDYYRYENNVDVISSDVPYVVEESFLINDESGNGDGLVDYGESILLSLSMQNIGNIDATNVTATLSTSNPYIVITNDTENYGDITAGEISNIENAFAFDVDNLIPDNEAILFEIEATDGTDTWISQILMVSHAPVLEYVEYDIDDTNGNNNGKLDPGETADLTVSIINSGSSDAFGVMGELLSSDTYISINTGSQSFGELTSMATGSQVYSITADASTPEGHQVNFDFEITGEGGIGSTGTFMTVVGKYLALVLDLDTKNYSGPGIYETFQDMDLYSEYMTSFPEDLDLYKNVFVCLGLHFTNYELTQEEGQLLKDFLLNGGNIWMEGRLTWKEDPQTPVHEMFNIEVEDKTMFVYNDILGANGTFAGGTSFVYDGHNPVGNYAIVPEYPAFSLFTIQDPFYGAGVAYNAGNYKTIGTTFEFGKLLDGSSPSTKADMMQKILAWFDGTITGIDKTSFTEISTTGISDSYPNPFTDETAISVMINQSTEATLTIFNMQGEQVKVLLNNVDLKIGKHEYIWDGTNDKGVQVPPAVYFGVLKTDNGSDTQKLILMN